MYKIDKVSVFLKKDFKEYDIDQKKLILAIMNSTTLTNGGTSGQSILFDNKNELDDIIDSSSKLIMNFTNIEIKISAKIPIIDSFDIDELVSNPENKKHLWNSIKALLNLWMFKVTALAEEHLQESYEIEKQNNPTPWTY